MNIGFDAKRAFHNGTGLGHYSRTLLKSLSEFHPEHQYYLFNPRASGPFQMKGENIHEILPSGLLNTLFPSAWRSRWVSKDLKRLRINLFHGLSHEIPVGMHHTGIPSVVTIHDLIHERYPEQYNPIDVQIYRKKFRYACGHANKIIAISEQTKKDIIQYYKIPGEKITVCYQACDPSFGQTVPPAKKTEVLARYGLPKKYFLTVGSIIERKNLLNICKALYSIKDEMNLPLVVIGDGGKYKRQVKAYIDEHGMGDRIIFLSENPAARHSQSFLDSSDFPAIYQAALALVYPSTFEGFGIPVLEAQSSGLPVITSNLSGLTEAAGDAAVLVDPASVQEIAGAMIQVITRPELVSSLSEKGKVHARSFSRESCAEKVMQVYQELC
jgi:glycosyltransferase involved in cell wall biosynthesis